MGFDKNTWNHTNICKQMIIEWWKNAIKNEMRWNTENIDITIKYLQMNWNWVQGIRSVRFEKSISISFF